MIYKDYKILVADDLINLEEFVNLFLERGFTLIGGIVVRETDHHLNYYQAIARKIVGVEI